ncbi:MAG: deoxyribodipyrimidine photo-lyase [Saprospiraceae bacterium]|nr:deoxyribodipyrimidine photo-lyase [Saprospiraceae bacterium]
MKLTFFWCRRDLRMHDNAGLYHALKYGQSPVLPLFIFDKDILDDLTDPADARVTFIHQTVMKLKKQMQDQGSDMLIMYGKPIDVWKELSDTYDIDAVYTNRDYEPYAKERDRVVSDLLNRRGIHFHHYKDHVLFEAGEVLKGDGDPYVVFTPYKRTWLQKLHHKQDSDGSLFYLKSYPSTSYLHNLYAGKVEGKTTLKDIGFQKSPIQFPPDDFDLETIELYHKQRDFPACDGTTRLGLHLRFGTISIRALARSAIGLNETFLSELIWRDFYSQILAYYPHVVDGPFRSKYDRVPWRDSDADFQIWCEGLTGYPLVDAGMRELNTTGYMHNRVRMVTASFLTKHLLIDWRRGEAYFAEKLLDYDLASNNGGWQWAAGCGTDAAPYFRIFNPTTQLKRFDPDFKYTRKWIPELDSLDYPEPMVDHKFARARCLDAFKQALDT